VTRAAVRVDGEVVGVVGTPEEPALCVLVGVTHDDGPDEATWIADKVANLRILRDAHDPQATMERSVLDTGGAVLVVSQFTLYGRTAKGRRPSWVDAARPEQAAPLVDALVARLDELGVTTATGVFGADMQVELVNDGPVTVIVERDAT
jgi:D-tyrosyl-tRNA(Tyr) deacylase